MAKKGLSYVCAGILNESAGTYSGGKYFGASAKFNAAANTNSAKDYGDNMCVATDTAVTGGTVSVEINEFTNEIYAWLLGHAHDEEKNIVTCNAKDIAPFVGVGCIGQSDGPSPYKAVVYKRAQFKEPSNEYDSKQETVSYAHTSLEGDFYTLSDGSYSIKAGFDTEAKAKEYLDTMFGIGAVEGA